MYINDLPLAKTNSNTSMYADDTSTCYHSHEVTQLNEAINNDNYKLEKWLDGNKLSLNVGTTHAMLISRKQKYKDLQKQGISFVSKLKARSLILLYMLGTLVSMLIALSIGRNTYDNIL